MSSDRRPNPLRLLSVRLSVTYALCCLVSMMAVLGVCYLFLEGSLRRQMDGVLANEIPEYRSLLESQNRAVLEDALLQEVLSEGIDQVFFRILDGHGTIEFTTDTTSWNGLRVENSAVQSALSGKLVFSDFRDDEQGFNARILYGRIGENLILQLGESLSGNRAILNQFRDVFTLATLAFVFCSVLAGFYMAQRALAGVQRVTLVAGKITAGAWDHRVPVSRHDDEIDELARAFNTMVDRIQTLFRELRDVTDDIAHDLRTPLMRIRGEAELALGEDSANPVEHERCGSILEECDQMLHLINTMLEISQTEAGAKALERHPMDGAVVAEDVVELFRPAAEDKGLHLSLLASGSAPAVGESARIKRALAHLVDNAIKYTPAGGEIRVTCRQDGRFIGIAVQDTGPGIPPELREAVFGRFYRADASRTEPGNGLGLSLSRAIVRAHGGDILVSDAPEGGSEFLVRLPRSDSAPG